MEYKLSVIVDIDIVDIMLNQTCKMHERLKNDEENIVLNQINRSMAALNCGIIVGIN